MMMMMMMMMIIDRKKIIYRRTSGDVLHSTVLAVLDIYEFYDSAGDFLHVE